MHLKQIALLFYESQSHFRLVLCPATSCATLAAMPPCMAAVMVNAGRRSYEEQVKRREEQRGKLREALLNKSRQLGKMFREMDENGDGGVDKAEFRKAVPLLGIPMMKSMPMEDIDDLFDDLDVDGSGTISYKELKKLLQEKERGGLLAGCW